MKERYKNVTVEEITPDEFDHAATRDKGIRQSDADIVICMTQDACPDNEYLVSELVQALEEANVAVAYARQLPRKESTLLERYTRQFNYPPESKVKSSKDLEKMGIKTFFCSDVCAAYNRDMYLKNGGFEKKAIFNEDMIYAAKVIENEQKVYYNAKARVIHSHNYNFSQQFHRNFDMAVSQAQHPEIFRKVSSEKEGMKLIKNTDVDMQTYLDVMSEERKSLEEVVDLVKNGWTIGEAGQLIEPPVQEVTPISEPGDEPENEEPADIPSEVSLEKEEGNKTDEKPVNTSDNNEEKADETGTEDQIESSSAVGDEAATKGKSTPAIIIVVRLLLQQVAFGLRGKGAVRSRQK